MTISSKIFCLYRSGEIALYSLNLSKSPKILIVGSTTTNGPIQAIKKVAKSIHKIVKKSGKGGKRLPEPKIPAKQTPTKNSQSDPETKIKRIRVTIISKMKESKSL